MATKMKIILLKHASRWELPSVSVGCIQAEAYLRMAGTEFATEELSTAGTSPTGLLPAVDTPTGAGGFATEPATDLDAAAAVIDFLQLGVVDLDCILNRQQNADRVAFTCLIETKLNPAVLFSTWCEWNSAKHLRAVYGDTLPWPLNYIIPFGTSMSVKKRFRDTQAEAVYSDGCAALQAVRDRLTTADGPYLFGKKPTSLDAKVYGLLTYILSAPVIAPVLKDLVKESAALMAYVELISQNFFTMAAPSVLDGDADGSWTAAAKGAGAPGAAPKQTEEEKKASKRSMYWLGGVATLLVAYVTLGGQYFDVSLGDEFDEGDDEE